MKRCIMTGFIPLLTLLLAHAAHGQTTSEREGARAAANQGLQAFKDGNFEEAIERFNRANELVLAPTHTLFLARAHEKLGRLIEARNLYNQIVRQKLANDASAPFIKAQQQANLELEVLKPRIPRITVSILGPGKEGARVLVDGNPYPKADIDVNREIDPGRHRFQAQAKKNSSPVVTILVKEGQNQTVTLTLQEPASATTNPLADSEDGDKGGMDRLTVGGLAALGVGLVGLGAGAYFMKQKADRKNEADILFDACNPRVCTARERSRISSIDKDANKAKGTAFAGFIVGGVAIAGGITMLWLAQSHNEPNTTASIRPWVGVQRGGISGTF